MFNFFKKSNTFPKETEAGNCFIIDDKLHYEDHGNLETVDLTILKYAYVEVLGDRPFLFLFDYYQHYIPVGQKGFAAMYHNLSKRYGFDDACFFKIIRQKKELKARIWLKKQSQNYSILANAPADYLQGFEVLCSPTKFISWDTPYGDYQALAIGHLYQDEFENASFKIDFPVRIGAIQVQGLEFYADNIRKDIPVPSFYTMAANAEANDSSYQEFRDHWMKQIPTDMEDAGYERVDQKHLSFDLQDLWFSITYSYGIESCYDDGCTSILITNHRDYSEMVLTGKSMFKITKPEIVAFNSLFDFIPDYRKNPRMSSIPEAVKSKIAHHQAVWIDPLSKSFGFTGDQFSINFHVDEVENICIQNVLPAKGGGYAELSVLLQSSERINIYYAEQNAVDTYASALQHLLGIPVEFPQPYYNC